MSNIPVYDSLGLVTYGRHVDRRKGKFARKVRRFNARRRRSRF